MKICIITARKNSQRLPNKNNKILGGRFLFDWTLHEALLLYGAQKVHEIRIISNDLKLLKRYKGDKRILILRESEELGANGRHIDAILWGLDDLTDNHDIILLQSTSPFRTSADVKYFLDCYNGLYPIAAVDTNWNACGAIYIIKLRDLRNYRSFHTPMTKYIPLPYPANIDIDDWNDWNRAERILKERG